MCSFEWIGLHFKAIFRRLNGFERPEICPVDSMDASLDTLRVLQRERVGRPPSNGPAGPGSKSREINTEMQFKTP